MTERYIGLMSGTSLDGVDAVLATFDEGGRCNVTVDFFVPYPTVVRDAVLALQPADGNELDRAARLGNTLTGLYAEAVRGVLDAAGLSAADIAAIGCHGQTIRHAPHAGYSLQIGNLAGLAEATGIDVCGDFRSRDVAAGGHGAPLVPAFHEALFAHPEQAHAIVNIGGISNLTRLDPEQPVIGFDCGPGNMLMDAWCQRHTGARFDQSGGWAASGTVDAALLESLLAEPFFAAEPPKSTGRDLFDLAWLEARLASFTLSPADVQATLLELTAASIADAITRWAASARSVYVCGGGAMNDRLMARLAEALPDRQLSTTDVLGLPVHQVEAAAFAWLARQLIHREPGNLPAVTGANGPRVLGAIYPR